MDDESVERNEGDVIILELTKFCRNRFDTCFRDSVTLMHICWDDVQGILLKVRALHIARYCATAYSMAS